MVWYNKSTMPDSERQYEQDPGTREDIDKLFRTAAVLDSYNQYYNIGLAENVEHAGRKLAP